MAPLRRMASLRYLQVSSYEVHPGWPLWSPRVVEEEKGDGSTWLVARLLHFLIGLKRLEFVASWKVLVIFDVVGEIRMDEGLKQSRKMKIQATLTFQVHRQHLCDPGFWAMAFGQWVPNATEYHRAEVPEPPVGLRVVDPPGSPPSGSNLRLLWGSFELDMDVLYDVLLPWLAGVSFGRLTEKLETPSDEGRWRTPCDSVKGGGLGTGGWFGCAKWSSDHELLCPGFL
ncbi:unnamed protein product [Durusdinium trenchii]|uniref:Uncharacterized protein n=1 Tax=Durusdinium trenchii TaxID=1381693 RepID=A0ABP0KBR5_9DINO